MSDIVWEATVDGNTWKAQVVRTGDYTGTLEVYRVDGNDLIHSESVGLSYQAIFGPDVEDVAEWQVKALDVIDAQ